MRHFMIYETALYIPGQLLFKGILKPLKGYNFIQSIRTGGENTRPQNKCQLQTFLP